MLRSEASWHSPAFKATAQSKYLYGTVVKNMSGVLHGVFYLNVH